MQWGVSGMKWFVHIADDYRFAMDQYQLVIGKKDSDDNVSYLKPIPFDVNTEFSPPVAGVHWEGSPAEVTTLIPRDLAIELFEALGRQLIDTADPYQTIKRLERELRTANQRVDSLIAGIGRMGGMQ